MSHFYHLGDRTGDRICDAVCEYKSPSGYCSLTICSKQFDQYLNMNLDTSSFQGCILCMRGIKKGDVLYNMIGGNGSMLFEEVPVYYCPGCGRKV